MIKLHELSESTRGLLDLLSAAEVQSVLDMATDIMLRVEQRPGQARLGENGAVELVLRMVVFYNAEDLEG
jgi:hypothetical protein